MELGKAWKKYTGKSTFKYQEVCRDFHQMLYLFKLNLNRITIESQTTRLCMDMFNCDDVATLLTKRKQKFAGSFARIGSILCELVVA